MLTTRDDAPVEKGLTASAKQTVESAENIGPGCRDSGRTGGVSGVLGATAAPPLVAFLAHFAGAVAGLARGHPILNLPIGCPHRFPIAPLCLLPGSLYGDSSGRARS